MSPGFTNMDEAMDLRDETQFLGEVEGEEETQSSIVTNALQQTTLNLAGSSTTSQSIKSTPTAENCNKKGSSSCSCKGKANEAR